MEDISALLIFFGLIVGWFLLLWIFRTFEKAGEYDELRKRHGDVSQRENALESEINGFKLKREKEIQEWEEKITRDTKAIEQIAKERFQGMPWLSLAYADYVTLEEQKIEDHLRTKSRPALKAAEEIREAGRRRRESEKNYRQAKYLNEYYQALFPILKDVVEEEEDELEFEDSVTKLGGVKDPLNIWLSDDEYSSLSKNEQYSLAMDRYNNRRKTKWEIGRDYERYIGYLWEAKNYRVSYVGIIQGYEDMGRDLIAKKEDKVEIIQCKYWSARKTIHEKHIFQLFGTVMEYWLNNCKKSLESQQSFEEFYSFINNPNVNAVFVTSTQLSEKAKNIADALNVRVIEQFGIKDYPKIKCNVSSSNEKIYHLPFDQAYDKVIIEPEKGEFYASTISQAMSAGFRRAYKWRGRD